MNGGKYIKLSASGGAVSGTGSTSSHNHSGPGGHGHPGGGSHTHPLGSTSSGNESQNSTTSQGTTSPCNPAWPGDGGYPLNFDLCHIHPLSGSTTSAAGTGSYGSGSQGIAQASSVYPAYKTVTWIMAPEEPAAGGGNVGMFGANF